MRILHTIRSVSDEGGGVIEAVKQLCNEHQKDGHTAQILSLDSPTDIPSQFPVKVTALGPGRGKFGFTRSFVPWLRNEAKNFDAVVINGIWQYHSFGAWRALRSLGTPFFVFPHGMLDPWFKQAYPFKHLKKWLYWPWSDYRVLRDARAVLFTCEEERLRARGSFWLYRCREHVVALGIAKPPGDPARQKAQFLRQYPTLKDKRLVLFLGRLHEKKGSDLLLKAFARTLGDSPRLGASFHPLHLVMAGPGSPESLAHLQALAEDFGISSHVTWTGMLRGDLKWGALHAAEVFVLPSHQENFGIAVAEALACSLPVLISNKVNIWREIEQDGAGLVDNDNENGALRLLKRWLSLNGQDQALHRARAYHCFINRFEIGHSAKAFLEVVQNTNRESI